MGQDIVRSTLYLDPGLHQALCLKAATTHRSMSDIVNDAIRAMLRDDEEDLAAFAERAGEPSIGYEEFLSIRWKGSLDDTTCNCKNDLGLHSGGFFEIIPKGVW